MMDNLHIMSFLWGAWWSFVFSLPPGMINLSVLDATVNRHLKSGIILAAAACIIEFLQSFVGTKFSTWFFENPLVGQIIKIAIIPIFAILAIRYFIKARKAWKRKKAGEGPVVTKKRIGSFGRGLVVGLLNPIAIPFFIVLAAKTEEQGLLQNDWYSIIIYVLGTTVGTFLAFMVYGILSRFIAKKLQAIKLWLDIIIGSIFAFLAIEQGAVAIIKLL